MSAIRLLAQVGFLTLHWVHALVFLWPASRRRAQSRRQTTARAVRPPTHAAPPTDADFERWARAYDALASPFTIPLFATAIREVGVLPEGARVLDLGCGPGRELCALAARNEVAEAVGVDTSPSMLRLAQDRASRLALANVATIRADAADLPPEMHDSFDLAWASLVHHHFAEPERVARAVLGSLRPGGRYCIVDHLDEPVNRRLAPLARIADPGWRGYLSSAELAGLLLNAGFARVRASSLAPGIGIAVAERSSAD